MGVKRSQRLRQFNFMPIDFTLKWKQISFTRVDDSLLVSFKWRFGRIVFLFIQYSAVKGKCHSFIRTEIRIQFFEQKYKKYFICKTMLPKCNNCLMHHLKLWSRFFLVICTWDTRKVFNWLSWNFGFMSALRVFVVEQSPTAPALLCTFSTVIDFEAIHQTTEFPWYTAL